MEREFRWLVVRLLVTIARDARTLVARARGVHLSREEQQRDIDAMETDAREMLGVTTFPNPETAKRMPWAK